MPFNRASLTELIERNAADVEAQLPGVDARLRRSLLGVLTKTHAKAMHASYGFLDYISRQVTIATAEGEILDSHASTWLVTRKAPAQAVGAVVFTGTDSTVIPQGTIVQRSDSTEYATDDDGTITGGSVTINVTAVEGGADTDTAANSTLTLVSPIAGVDSDATVDSDGLTGGTDTETDDQLRARLQKKIQQPPHGGAAHDYEIWSLEVSGVTRAWVFPLQSGAGTVGVTFVVDGSTPIIPNAAKVTEVQNYIDALRPVTATVTVFAPTAQTLNVTIALTPDTTTVRNAVQSQLDDLIFRKGTPGGALYLSQINEAISLATGEIDHDLQSPIADIAVDDDEIYEAVSITWA